jgi:hypothetical protein
MIRGLVVAAAVAAAAIGAASTLESTGSSTSPVMFTASPGNHVPLAVHCVPPTPQPGDTYQCRDGCYSDSKTRQGACSHHGGPDHPVQTDNA